MILLSLFCIGYYLLASLCVNIGYHRALSHRSLRLSIWFERIIITLGLPAGTPIQWVGNHRHHHAHTDEIGDPHSPVIDGFWHAHNGWYIGTKNPILCILYSFAGPLRALYDGYNRPRTNQEFNYLAQNVTDISYYNWISKPYFYLAIVWSETLIFFGGAYVVWGIKGLICLWITSILIYNFGDFVDSLAHLRGKRPYEVRHYARNHWITGIMAGGEWHANHHTFPQSAKFGLLPNQFDLSWEMIRLLRWLGIATHVLIADADAIQRQKKGT
jgi:fatty-acid desaturase